MANYTRENDDEQAKALALRWEECSEEARLWAAANCGRYFGILPHVLAEVYDEGRRSVDPHIRMNRNG